MKLLPFAIAVPTVALTIVVLAAPDKKPGSITSPGSGPAASPVLKEAGLAAGDIIARVGDSDIGLDEVRADLAKLSPAEQAAIAKDPALLNQVVRVLLVQRLMLEEAAAKKWDQRPEVKAAVERARENAIAESYLAAMSAPAADYPSEAELRQAYELAKPKLSTPKQWRLAQIYIGLPQGASPDEAEKARARLESVKSRLAEEGADFASIAEDSSDDVSSAAAGGEIGWLTEAQVQPEIRTDVAILTAGAVSPALRMKDGWHIIRCLEVREATTVALDDVRGALTEQMREEKTRENSQAWMAKLVQDNPLAINEISLTKLLEDAGN